MANRQAHPKQTAGTAEAQPDAVRMVNDRLKDDRPTADYNLITFRVDRQVYALPVETILQIIAMVKITPFPTITAMRQPINQALLGVINVHGAVTPVVDLRRYLGLSECALQLYTPIILVYSQDKLLGLVVDEVVDVIHLGDDHLIPLTDIFPAGIGNTPILQGMANINGGLVPVLANEALFCELLTAEQSHSLNDLINELPAIALDAPGSEPGFEAVNGDEL